MMKLDASATWAAGSLLAAMLRVPDDPVLGLEAQLLPTGLVLGFMVWMAGLTSSFDLSFIPTRAWGALAFLIVASTLIGYAVFLGLNRRASPIFTTSFNYAAPVIALALSA